MAARRRKWDRHVRPARAVPAPEPRRGLRFLTVGAGNTLLDYVVFIGLTKVLHIDLEWVWMAKVASGGVAISTSFWLNRTWVFRVRKRLSRQAPAFLLVTVVALYAVQTPLTYFFTAIVQTPGDVTYDVLRAAGLTSVAPGVLTHDFAIKTAAFALATLVSMSCNFAGYRLWVFRPGRDPV
jgi:putative flippase GtrA